MNILLYILALFFIFIPSVSAQQRTYVGGNCSSFFGYISTENWPGGSITISCEGDGGPYCGGDRKTVTLQNGAPASYELNNCSCGPFVPTGLIKIETPLPPGCVMATDLGIFQAANGFRTQADFGIGCEGQSIPSPTPTTPFTFITVTPSPTRTPTPTPTRPPGATLTPTRTPTPTIPISCPVPARVPNVRVECPFCN